MKHCLWVACFAFIVTPLAAAARVPEPLVGGLKKPVGVIAGADGRIYVSTLGDGAVHVIDKGKATAFATGFDEPRGLAARAEWLYVVDKKGVWRINRQGKASVFAAVSAFKPMPHSLHSIDIDELGNLYVTDAGADGQGGAIYRLNPAGKVSQVRQANQPRTGLVMDGLSYVLTLDAATGNLLRVRLEDGSSQKVAEKLGSGSLVWDRHGRLYGSNGASKVFVIARPGEKPLVLADGFQAASGLALALDDRSILVADTRAGTVTSLPANVPGQEVDERPMRIKAVVAFPNLQWTGWKPVTDSGKMIPLRPIVLTHAGDNSNRVFVATQQGIVHVFPNDQKATKTSIFLDIHERVFYDDNENEQGFLGLTFHPKYKENGEFFVFYTRKKEKTINVLSRFRVRKDDPTRADPDSEEEILRIRRPFWNHDGGTICFGPDGFLYVALGDGGLANDPFGNGQKLNSLLGKILRINVDQKSKSVNYSIPLDNPFAASMGAKPEIWAYGLRNVWRMAFDRQTGDLWAADVGQNLYEEIDLIVRGGNYGWNRREALHPFGARGADVQKDLIDPIWEYHHDVGKSITGGFVYRGERLPELQGKYLYADYVSTRVWALSYDADKKRVTANRRITSPNVPVMSFGEDEKGEVYFMSYTTTGQGIYWFVKE